MNNKEFKEKANIGRDSKNNIIFIKRIKVIKAGKGFKVVSSKFILKGTSPIVTDLTRLKVK